MLCSSFSALDDDVRPRVTIACDDDENDDDDDDDDSYIAFRLALLLRWLFFRVHVQEIGERRDCFRLS